MKKLLILFMIIIATPTYAATIDENIKLNMVARQLGRADYLTRICKGTDTHIYEYLLYLIRKQEDVFSNYDHDMMRSSIKGSREQRLKYPSCTIKARIAMYAHQFLAMSKLNQVLPEETKAYTQNKGLNLFKG